MVLAGSGFFSRDFANDQPMRKTAPLPRLTPAKRKAANSGPAWRIDVRGVYKSTQQALAAEAAGCSQRHDVQASDRSCVKCPRT